MADDGPDPNDVRRHAKRMFTEMQYRQKYCRLDFYKPNRKQLEFHNTVIRERMLRAGNQQGKTHAAAAEMAIHTTQLYPEWLKGRRFLKRPAIERSYDFLGWCAAPFAQKVRDGMQTKLLGDLTEGGAEALGTGLIPLDNIVGQPTMARGISGFVDSVTIRRENGGKAIIRQKTYEQGRQAFAGEAVDVVWLDEDIKGDANGPIYSECLSRLTTTRGIIMVTMTPELGGTPLRKRFKEGYPGTVDILMTVDDALISNGGHIPDEDLSEILGKFRNESERMTKVYGADMQGEGAVFVTPVETIKHSLEVNDVPPHWPWLWALDFRHSGSVNTGHPFAAVLGCWDRDTDRIFIMHAIRMLGLASEHVKAIRAHMMKEAPVAWPHDGGRGGSVISGETIAQIYKKLGLAMRPTHATFPGSGFDFEAGITEMENRFAGKRLLVARHLAPVFDEYQGYHRINGLVNKIDDDLLSAIRVLCMDIRYAKKTQEFHAVLARGEAGGQSQFALGTPGHFGGDMDPFSGTLSP